MIVNAFGPRCAICNRHQMSPVIYVELRTLQEKGQITYEERASALRRFCLGHAGEWHPDFIIAEE